MGELHYSMLIQWSNEDQAYLVRLPDWEREERVLGPVTHGDPYADAVEHGQEALDALIASARQHQESLPNPNVRGSISKCLYKTCQQYEKIE